MHIWALNGLSPFGVLLCGQLAAENKDHQITQDLFHRGIPLALAFSGVTMLLGTMAALLSKRGLSNLYAEPLTALT
jgi:hypothetical protein